MLESFLMLVLASNSPRRKQLLSLGGWDFVVLAAQVDETVLPGELPWDYVRRLAEGKAYATMDMLKQPVSGDCIIIAADTVVVDSSSTGSEKKTKDGPFTYEILGKPAHAAEAGKILRQLRGRTHQVYTGLAVFRHHDDLILSEVSVTDVPMRFYSDEEIQAYIASGDPMDKAGAYAIQHNGFHPVEELKGCYTNVMGLPLCQLAQMLASFDIFPGTDIARTCQESLTFTCQVFSQDIRGGSAFS